MSNRIIEFYSKPNIICWSSVVGKKENEGPLGKYFDMVVEDDRFGLDTWEKAESHLQKVALAILLDKSGHKAEEIDGIFAGDLINQCTGSAFGIRDLGIPYIGIYGACSTSVLAMINAAEYVDSGKMEYAVSSTSSHFCSAEKQFRFPLEYGGQRPPTAQWTVTAAGAAMISSNKEKSCPRIEKAILGKMVDKGVKDANNMGAAMAPAAADTISTFLKETQTSPNDYDLILTGDLGKVGSQLLYELMEK
jgi:stage V sporulation protein AD